MRTSLNNIQAIEDHLFGRTETGEALLFEANMILNSSLREDIQHQQNTYIAIKQYSHQLLRSEIAAVRQKLENEAEHSGFMQSIINLFKNH